MEHFRHTIEFTFINGAIVHITDNALVKPYLVGIVKDFSATNFTIYFNEAYRIQNGRKLAQFGHHQNVKERRCDPAWVESCTRHNFTVKLQFVDGKDMVEYRKACVEYDRQMAKGINYCEQNSLRRL
jgi:hypothetical protein